ncbi:Prolycopene isomerase 1, chloroplastic [Gracilariopsis chorda]|uniref:Prolycopene isomerase 1, chloroplastic n=1 Tax=Gracilariopsis chorda TaxID=448386 RepID=A0A2V3IU19_9FLOR|nr:Prolycopene isomerase 1, chloroplastic [Gracilariopsis chorda]|eukprot:PXF45602.1 Prolycopene isomerase 1, chloroplastic [Gracilariopsis chorda]
MLSNALTFLAPFVTPPVTLTSFTSSKCIPSIPTDRHNIHSHARRNLITSSSRKKLSMRYDPELHGSTHDVIIIGSGFGGLCAAAMLTAYGHRPLLLESHYSPGGVAHGFTVKAAQGDFHFDTGPSFFCALDTPRSLNPLKQALDAVGEHVPSVSYPSFCIDDLKIGTVTVSENEERTLRSVRRLAGAEAAHQLRRVYDVMRDIHSNMDVPAIALRGDWKAFPILSRRWAMNMLSLLPYVGDVTRPVGDILQRMKVTHPFVKRILDTEAFLLSGLKTDGTITAEIAFMVGERCKPGAMQYPVGGASAIVDALVRGIQRKGGIIRLKSHVQRILVEDGVAVGVDLKSGERMFAKHVFSNASLWDTVNYLLPAEALPSAYRRKALQTPLVESFVHAHMAIPAEGLDDIIGHHAVIIDSDKDIALPGNTVMISIPTVWSPDLAPEGWHIVHCYTLEHYDKWPSLRKNREQYEAAKKRAAEPLFTAVRHVIPDLDERLLHHDAFVKLGSPLTHERFNRRYKGTYGAAIAAGKDEFEWPGDIPIKNLKRCSDSTFPGIGVPSSAAAGIIAANEIVGIREHLKIIDKVFPPR